MASSDVEICNLALSRIGVTAHLGSLPENSAPGRACELIYPQSRDFLLSLAPWPFATKRSTLGVIDNFTRTGWGYGYTLPSDCLLVREILLGYRNAQRDQRAEYTIEHYDNDKKVLLTDIQNPTVTYTARVEEPGRFPAPFVDALAWKIASDLAMALPVKQNYHELATRQFEFSLSRAGAILLMEPEINERESSIIRARGGFDPDVVG